VERLADGSAGFIILFFLPAAWLYRSRLLLHRVDYRLARAPSFLRRGYLKRCSVR
jgi:hypothetical protein